MPSSTPDGTRRPHERDRPRPISTSVSFFHRVRPISIGQFRFWDVEFWDDKVWGPRRMGPRRVEPRRVEPRRGPEISVFFHSSRHNFLASFSLLGPSVEFWWCLKRQDAQMCAFGVLWLSCEAPTARSKSVERTRIFDPLGRCISVTLHSQTEETTKFLTSTSLLQHLTS